MIDLDGNEGGGQILRSALALSAVTGTPFRVDGIRARRPNPGLAAQHLAVVRAFSRAFSAEVEGDELGSQRLSFRPGRPVGGELAVTIPTAGSLTLAAQALLPALALSGAFWDVHLTGGTDARFAPTWDAFSRAHVTLLVRHGLRARALLRRRGYYPRGGGAARIEVQPSALSPLRLEAPARWAISGRVASSQLPDEIGRRLRDASVRELGPGADVTVAGYPALDPGISLALFAEGPLAILCSDALGEKGVPSESVAKACAEPLLADVAAGASVDLHASDQLLVWIALCGGSYRARALTEHASTNARVVEAFLGPRVTIARDGGLVTFAAPSPR
ncbi:MAG TPA: RNA 3'-terminal phosphate cyclase [Candidatus Thermoplasmatota archaeon]|nr:RNA 3'-terminal phosphate cyclase [Candidatus Thermoplasmatota archaeon]